MIDKNFLINGALSGSSTAFVSTLTPEPFLPVLIGLLAPIIKEVLFRLVDRITEKIKSKKQK